MNTFTNDPVRPKHYHGDLVMRICEYFNLDACLFNTVKYILRAGDKVQIGEKKREAEIRDLKKAQWYLERRIMQLEDNPRIGNLENKVRENPLPDETVTFILSTPCTDK